VDNKSAEIPQSDNSNLKMKGKCLGGIQNFPVWEVAFFVRLHPHSGAVDPHVRSTVCVGHGLCQPSIGMSEVAKLRDRDRLGQNFVGGHVCLTNTEDAAQFVERFVGNSTACLEFPMFLAFSIKHGAHVPV
jgi:hypothetical protein